MKLIIILLITLSIFLVSCGEDARNFDNLDNIPVKTSPEGIKYKIVTIEGQKYIATQTINGFWTLALLPE